MVHAILCLIRCIFNHKMIWKWRLSPNNFHHNDRCRGAAYIICKGNAPWTLLRKINYAIDTVASNGAEPGPPDTKVRAAAVRNLLVRCGCRKSAASCEDRGRGVRCYLNVKQPPPKTSDTRKANGAEHSIFILANKTPAKMLTSLSWSTGKSPVTTLLRDN